MLTEPTVPPWTGIERSKQTRCSGTQAKTYIKRLVSEFYSKFRGSQDYEHPCSTPSELFCHLPTRLSVSTLLMKLKNPGKVVGSNLVLHGGC